MSSIFHEIFYRPILNLLVFLYNVIPGHDIGLAIIAITVISRIVLWPTFQSALTSQRRLQEIQPEIDALREKHKDNQQEQMAAITAVYREKKINPFSSCLPLLIQLPIVLALYSVLNNQLRKNTIEGLYSFVSNPGALNPISLGSINLSESNLPLAILAAVLQYVQAAYMQRKIPAGAKVDPTMKMMQAQILYVLPIVTFVIALKLPAGLPLYWAVTTLFAIVQQWFIIHPRRNSDSKAS